MKIFPWIFQKCDFKICNHIDVLDANGIHIQVWKKFRIAIENSRNIKTGFEDYFKNEIPAREIA